MLVRAREIVVQEKPDMGSRPIADLVDPHVGVIDRQIRPFEEIQAEEAPRGVEGRLDHVVEDEIRLQFGFVEIVLGLSHLLGIIAPVPRLDRLVHPLVRGGRR